MHSAEAGRNTDEHEGSGVTMGKGLLLLQPPRSPVLARQQFPVRTALAGLEDQPPRLRHGAAAWHALRPACIAFRPLSTHGAANLPPILQTWALTLTRQTRGKSLARASRTMACAAAVSHSQVGASRGYMWALPGRGSDKGA